MTEDEIPGNPGKSQLPSPDSPNKLVKSTAVVKYSAVPTPATFAQLQCNTDLNLPPSNWLSNSAESYGLQNVWSNRTGFSSFRMAHMFPDCVGEVDVVSDAENIKKLLKMPYSQGRISMMVHRVENTLLLDNFDIHKYLLKQAENEWEWLREFFHEHVYQNLSDKEKTLFPKSKSRNALQQKNLVSKFLYHSLLVANKNESITEKPSLPANTLQPSLPDSLPEPSREEELPDPNYNHNFARNVVWTFENIQMLIGTDMPIFGGQTHPCISLRLRDMTKPINVLTGIDYWLDNLMCNVPEVVMCYHLDGIVQRYELIKTEDLPNLDDAKFSPKVIRDIAQNILSFLKSNATKAGHTYWLFKGKDDDVVKLYDLTSLCNEASDDKGQNPFTIPVAMLLYRVARNMKYCSDYRRNRGTIRMLLKNCIRLLAKEKYPQIVTSAHYMLSDLYVPADTDTVNPGLEQSDDEDNHSECGSNPESERSEDKLDEEVDVAIKCLTLAKIKEQPDFEDLKYRPPPMSGTLEERCCASLEHVSEGLKCLKYFPNNSEIDTDKQDEINKESTEKNESDEENRNVAKPFEAIPMPYESLKKSATADSIETTPSNKKKNKQKKKKLEKNVGNSNAEEEKAKALLCKKESRTLPSWEAPKKSDNISWNAHLKTLLYEKASLVYAVLSEKEYAEKNYGSSLRYILAVLRCQKILDVFCKVRNDKQVSYLLGRAGDCCCMIVQDWAFVEKHRQDYEFKSVVEDAIVESMYTIDDLDINEVDLLPMNLDSLEGTLVASYKCYEKALTMDLESSDMDKCNLLRRLGNIHNELGVLYMNQAGSQYQQNDEIEDSEISALLARSLNHLEAGIKAFETIRDEANLALLHSNTGRLMRLSAHIDNKQHSRERHYYNKAMNSYQKALQVLGTRKTNPTIWDSVMWDQSTTLFNMATLLQDFPAVGNRSEEELEREVVEILQKVLKLCDTEAPGPRQPVYQFRAATVERRLASLYHKIYRELDPEKDSIKRKNNHTLCKIYYEKAAKHLLALEETTEYLTVQMERVALTEHQAQTSTSLNAKIKAYQQGLELILQCRPMLELIAERNKNNANKVESVKTSNVLKAENSAENQEEATQEETKQIAEEDKLIMLMEQRLQFLLRSLTKLSLTIGKNSGIQKKENENLSNCYKKCYSLTLKQNDSSTIPLTEHLANILGNIEIMQRIMQKQNKQCQEL